MAKNPKMIICRNCNTPISGKAKICPSCGAKNKKPFYKKGWLIILAAIVVIVVIGFTGSSRNKGEKFEWDDIELSNILPEPKSNVGKIIINDDDHFIIYIYKTSKAEYENYLEECQSAGFTVESEKSEMYYDAYNETGYKLSLWYNNSDEELHISLDAPMEMGTLQWPASEIASLLPIPKSNVGTISSESSDGVYIYVGDTSIDDYNAYVNECFKKGFSINYEKGDTYYYADNANGYHISLAYQGNNVMSIEIEKLEDIASDNIPATESIPASGNDDLPSAGRPETTPGETEELIDGMHPEFKEAMDSYEEFYDEYCEFMKEYSENPTDVTLLAKYSEMVSKLAEMDEKFEAWNEDKMNDVELKYYIEVSERITQKLLEIAQ